MVLDAELWFLVSALVFGRSGVLLGFDLLVILVGLSGVLGLLGPSGDSVSHISLRCCMIVVN